MDQINSLLGVGGACSASVSNSSVQGTPNSAEIVCTETVQVAVYNLLFTITRDTYVVK